MRCHAFTMSFSACISLASTFRIKGSWVHICNYYKASTCLSFIPQQGGEGDLQGVHNHTRCDTPSAVFDRHLFHFW